MNARLKELINNADDGQADALTLMPSTLVAILKELEKMCKSSDTILCEPVAGGPGFKISLKGAGTFVANSTYELTGTGTALSLDYFDLTIPGGGVDAAGDPLFPTYDSVKWNGPRLTYGTPNFPYSDSLIESDLVTAVPVRAIGLVLISRQVRANKYGNIIYIGPEIIQTDADMPSYLTTDP